MKHDFIIHSRTPRGFPFFSPFYESMGQLKTEKGKRCRRNRKSPRSTWEDGSNGKELDAVYFYFFLAALLIRRIPLPCSITCETKFFKTSDILLSPDNSPN